MVEAAEQLTRALDQIATLPMTSVLRRGQIKLQVGLMNALTHIKGMTAPETKAAAERARLLIETLKRLENLPTILCSCSQSSTRPGPSVSSTSKVTCYASFRRSS